MGRPKFYDDRTLSIMLEQLNEQLQTLHQIGNAQQSLVDNLQKLQGSEVLEVARALGVTTPIQPSVKTTEKPGEDGQLAVTEKTTERGSITPSAPPLPEVLAAPSYTPSYGLSSQDLLSSQLNLSYQIFNLRILLERSLSDRLYGKEPRLQAVLGFQISIDPSSIARDHAAYVELTVTPRRGGDISLVSLLPQERTLNAMSLNNQASAVGGSLLTRILTFGFNERRRRQMFDLFQEPDTLAFESNTGPIRSSTRFGWVFRPVLGRRSVRSGVRQVFAVVALPAADVSSTNLTLDVTVRSYWRRYERGMMATSWRMNRYDWEKNDSVEVYDSAFAEENLAPQIDRVELSSTDTATGFVHITGRNFFTGTRVLLGNSILDNASSGLTIKSKRTLEVRAPLRDLALGDAVVSGRYGGSARLGTGGMNRGIRILGFSFPAKTDQDKINLEIDIVDRDGKDLNKLPENGLLLSIGDTFIPGPYDLRPLPGGCSGVPISPTEGATRACWRLIAVVPRTLLSVDTMVGIRFPFRGPNWADAQLSYVDKEPELKVTWLGGDTDVRLAIAGKNFTDTWKVVIDKDYEKDKGLEVSPKLLTLKVPKSTLDNYKKLILVPPDDDPRLLDIPTPTPPPPKPSIVRQAVTVKKNASIGAVYEGKALAAIKTAKFEGAELPILISSDDKGEKITVFLSRAVTKEAGPVQIILETSDGTRIPVDVIVEP